MKMKDFGLRVVVLVLATCCLAALSFAVPLTASNPDNRAYDPLLDMNNDGTIDIFDTIIMAGGFGGTGTPATKAVLLYDSGWINISDKAGQNITVFHDLGTIDGIVDITGKIGANGGPHQIQIGGAEYKVTLGKLYGGFDNDAAFSLVQTSDNGYVMLCKGFAGLIKTDVNGSLEWSRDYILADTGLSWARGVVIKTNDGGFAIAGNSYNTTTFTYSPLLIKTDSNGKTVWNRTYGGENGDGAYSLIKTNDGGYAFAGLTGSFGAYGSDVWLMKIDADGNVQWTKSSFKYGLAWVDSSLNSITLARGEADLFWNFVRVSIWKPRT